MKTRVRHQSIYRAMRSIGFPGGQEGARYAKGERDEGTKASTKISLRITEQGSGRETNHAVSVPRRPFTSNDQLVGMI